MSFQSSVFKFSGRRAAATGAVAMALVAAACGGSGGGSGSPSAGSSGGSSGGAKTSEVLKVGIGDQFEHENPFDIYDVMDFNVLMLQYPFLVQYNAAGQVAPDLAKSWSTSPDGLTWTFHLAPNAKWSDGKPLTSADVVWTLNTIIKDQAGATALYAENVTNLTSATAPNATTVVLHYKAPLASALAYLDNTPILPEHVWGQYATGNGSGLKTFADKTPIVGGGPYYSASWNGTTSLIMKRNPYYYGTPAEQAEVGLEYYTTPDGLIQALKSHQLDYVNNLPASSAADVKQQGIVVNDYKSVNYVGLFFNMKAPVHSEILNSVVREAMNDATDRQQIIDVAYPGAQAGESIVTPAVGAGWDPKVTPPTFNVAEANKLLDQAGYTKGTDGIRVANGHKMSYTVIVDHGELAGAGDRTFQILQHDFSQVGISLTEKDMDTTAFLTQMFGQNNSYTGWDLALEQDAGLYDPGYDLAYFTCGDFGSFNDSGWCDKNYDKLYNEQAVTLSTAKRQELEYAAQEYADKVLPAEILLYTPTVDAHLSNWTGFGANPYGSLNPLSKTTFTSIHAG